MRGRAHEVHAFDLLQGLGAIVEEGRFIRGDLVDADAVDIVHRRAHGDDAFDVGRARFELVGQVVVGRFLEGDGKDHVAAALPGGHGFQVLRLGVEHAHAGRAIHLVGRAGEEIHVELGNVDGHVGRALRTIQQHGHADGVGFRDDFFDGINGAEGVGNVHHGNELRALVQERIEFFHDHFARIVDRHDLEHGTGFLAEHLPRHDVGVVLHVGDEDLVALADVLAAVGLGHDVDGLGRAARKHNLAGDMAADELRDLLARLFVGVRGHLAEMVYAAMHVGVLRVVVVRNRLHHLARRLRGGRVVQVDEGLAPLHEPENREVGADPLHVDGAGQFVEAVSGDASSGGGHGTTYCWGLYFLKM